MPHLAQWTHGLPPAVGPVKSLQDRTERFDSSKRSERPNLHVRDACAGKPSEDLCDFVWPSGKGFRMPRPDPGRYDLRERVGAEEGSLEFLQNPDHAALKAAAVYANT